MTLNPYEVFVTPSALADWRAIWADGRIANKTRREVVNGCQRFLRQAVLVENTTAMTLVPDGYDPKRIYYVADSPTRGRLVFVLRPNKPGETGHTLCRVLKEQK